MGVREWTEQINQREAIEAIDRVHRIRPEYWEDRPDEYWEDQQQQARHQEREYWAAANAQEQHAEHDRRCREELPPLFLHLWWDADLSRQFKGRADEQTEDALAGMWDRLVELGFGPGALIAGHAAHLRALPYREYLLTDEWALVRQYALDRAGHRCQLCNRATALQVHHRTYEHRGKERLTDVTVLCARHHRNFHNKD